MKKILLLLFAAMCMIFLSACVGKSKYSGIYKQAEGKIEGFKTKEDYPEVFLDDGKLKAFLDFIDYDNTECPYAEIFNIDEAISAKSGRDFAAAGHKYDFLQGDERVYTEKLIENVKRNNEEFLKTGANKHFYKKLSASETEKICEKLADVINWGIENKGIDKNEISCVLGNLKLLKKNSPDYGAFNPSNGILTVMPDMIKHSNKKGVSLETTICHEAMHIMQSRCSDCFRNEGDMFIGISYKFDGVPVNSLNTTWTYEASAELNMSRFCGVLPTTYLRMTDAMEFVDMSTLLSMTDEAELAENIAFTKNENALYELLGFKDKRKAAEFLYAWEVLLDRPEDFKRAYENKYGVLSDYGDFVKTTYYPYLCATLTKLFYKNLARELSEHSMKVSDIFYLISVYEMNLKRQIDYGSSAERERFDAVFKEYLSIQDTFFTLFDTGDFTLKDDYFSYNENYDDSGIYANADLGWMDKAMREYVLQRNSNLYDEKFEKVVMAYK